MNNHPTFENHYQALNYYKKKWREADDRLQDFLIHHNKVLQERKLPMLKELASLQAEINFHASVIERNKVHHGSGVSLTHKTSPSNVITGLAPEHLNQENLED